MPGYGKSGPKSGQGALTVESLHALPRSQFDCVNVVDKGVSGPLAAQIKGLGGKSGVILEVAGSCGGGTCGSCWGVVADAQPRVAVLLECAAG